MFRAIGEPCTESEATEALCEWSVAVILETQLKMLVPKDRWILVLSALNTLLETRVEVGVPTEEGWTAEHVASVMRSVLHWTTPKHHWPLVLSTLMKWVRVKLEGSPNRAEVL